MTGRLAVYDVVCPLARGELSYRCPRCAAELWILRDGPGIAIRWGDHTAPSGRRAAAGARVERRAGGGAHAIALDAETRALLRIPARRSIRFQPDDALAELAW